MSNQSPVIISSGGSPFVVYRDGAEISSHSMEHTAITTASKEKAMYPESNVVIKRSLELRVELQTAEAPVEEPVEEEPLAEGVASFQTGAN